MTVDTFRSPYITVIDDRDSKNPEVFSEEAKCVLSLFKKDSDASGLVYPRSQREIGEALRIGNPKVRKAIKELEEGKKIEKFRLARVPGDNYQLLPKRRLSEKKIHSKFRRDPTWDWDTYTSEEYPLVDLEVVENILLEKEFASFIKPEYSGYIAEYAKLERQLCPTPGYHLYQMSPRKEFWKCWLNHRKKLIEIGFQVIPAAYEPKEIQSIFWRESDLWAVYFHPHIFLRYCDKEKIYDVESKLRKA